MNRLKLRIPSDNELEYRRKLIADEATMAYNAGYDDTDGCAYHQTPDQTIQWYKGWNKDNNRFYAYIVRSADNTLIGEVNVHKNGNSSCYDMGIVLEAKYRGFGYSTEALKLLSQYAFDILGADAIHNDFEETRIAAVKTHLSAGFTECCRKDGIIELLITREQYKRQNECK